MDSKGFHASMSTTAIPNGAVLALTQHLADIFQSHDRGTSIEVEGKVGGEDDDFVATPHSDGTIDVKDKWFGRNLDLSVAAQDDTVSFKSVGGDLSVDVTARNNGRGYDLVGMIDNRKVEYHRVVHAGVHESGFIGDIAFGLNRWVDPHGVVLKGSMGKSPILEQIRFATSPSPNVKVEKWSGPCGDVGVDETVTYTVTGKG